MGGGECLEAMYVEFDRLELDRHERPIRIDPAAAEAGAQGRQCAAQARPGPIDPRIGPQQIDDPVPRLRFAFEGEVGEQCHRLAGVDLQWVAVDVDFWGTDQRDRQGHRQEHSQFRYEEVESVDLVMFGRSCPGRLATRIP